MPIRPPSDRHGDGQNSSGSFTATVAISGLTGGAHTLIAVGADGSTSTAALTVTGKLTLSATSGAPGTTVTAKVAGFQAGEVVTFRWKTATGTILGNVTANAKGTGSTSIVIPTATLKAYSVYAIGSDATCRPPRSRSPES